MSAAPVDPLKAPRRQRLLSAKQAALALSLMTLASLVVGVVVVRGLGENASAPPLNINTTAPPNRGDQEPAFEVLEQDNPLAGDGGSASGGDRQRWAESFLPRSAGEAIR